MLNDLEVNYRERGARMKIIVFGATGKTGQLFLEEALKAGFDITAYVRNPDKLKLKSDHLKIIKGSVLNFEEVSLAMAGNDAVVSCLGGDGNEKSTILTEMSDVIVKAMKETKVKRIVYASTAGIHNEFPFVTNFIVKLFLGNAIKDHKGAAKNIMIDSLDYTILRPLALTDGPKTGKYRAVTEGVPKGGKKISRADYASFIAEVVKENKYIKQSIGLAY